MKNSSVKAIFTLLFVFSTCLLSAQYQDFGSWWNFELTKDLKKDFSTEIKLSQRFDENSLGYDRSQATLSLAYAVLKGLELEGGYRLVLVKNIPEGLETKFRLHGSLKYEYKFSSLSIDFRDQLQYGFDDLNSIDYFYDNKFVNRTRLGANYPIYGAPLDAHASYEFFLDLNSIYGVNPIANRIKLGIKYTLSGKSSLDLTYLFEDEFNVVKPLTMHILVVSYAYKL